MFFAIARQPDGPSAQLSTFDGLTDVWAQGETMVWVDIEEPTETDLQRLTGIIPLDSGAVEDCLVGEQRPRVDEFDDYIFLVLYGLRGAENENGDEIVPRKLAAFCGKRFLITVHHRALPSVSEMRERCIKNPAQFLAGGVDEVLYRIVDRMVDRYIEVVERYEDQIETLEERSLADHVERELLNDAAQIRASLLDVRHLAISQRELIRPLANGDVDHIGDDLGPRFRHVADHLAQVIEMTDSLREQLSAIRENFHAAIATRTNEVIKTLTIFATIMLPLTFVAGVYGMNLPLWPSPENPASFWIVVVSMALVAGVMLAYFRRKRWL